MITILSPDARERTALAALCESRKWPVTTCDSLRAFRRSLRGLWPKVVIARQTLSDGYSDDVLRALAADSRRIVKLITLLPASAPSQCEARQIALGADCVLRDPLRPNVLAEYLAKYSAQAIKPARTRKPREALPFAGATLHPTERKLQRGARTVSLTPREVALARLLADSRGETLTYDELFQEILGRRFRGDTSNMRVLLGKLCASAATLGIDLRHWLQVIPKTGYRFAPPPLRPLKSRTPALTAA